MDIIEPNVNTRQLFTVHIIEDGTYLVIRDSSPMFCFSGNTLQEAVAKAEDAFEFMRKIR